MFIYIMMHYDSDNNEQFIHAYSSLTKALVTYRLMRKNADHPSPTFRHFKNWCMMDDYGEYYSIQKFRID